MLEGAQAGRDKSNGEGTRRKMASARESVSVQVRERVVKVEQHGAI